MGTPNDPAPDNTSLTLIGSAKVREPEAWRRLVQLYSPAIFRWARRANLQEEDAADIVQEVWVSVSANLDRFRKDGTAGTFRGWLWTIARNKVRDRARRLGEAGSGGTAAQLAMGNIPEAEPADETDSGAPGMVERALEFIRPDFEPHTWQAFWRTAVLGQPAREVADDLGMAPNAVHQARFRIVKRLRRQLTALGVVDDPSFAGILPAGA